MKKTLLSILIAASFLATGCTRIPTGEVGLRQGFDAQVSTQELQPGSFNQTLVGSVLKFPVKEVTLTVENLTPLALDNSTIKDMDLSIVYSINPSQVGEIYNTKSKAFHTVHDGEVFLMYNYLYQAARNAAYKSARKYAALDMNDSRQAIEVEIKQHMLETLAEEKLSTSVVISQVLVRGIVPADSVVASANELVRAKNELKQKEVEVKTAEAESRRMAALTQQSAQSISYMNAQATLNISEGIKSGKVQTVVVPVDFRGMVNVGAK